MIVGLKRVVFLFFVALVIGGCGKEQIRAEKAMYFWKTQLVLTDEDRAFVQKNAIKKLYVRYCDVGLVNDEPVPIAPVQIDTASIQTMSVVPVVYLKNEIFMDIRQENYITELAGHLTNYIGQINKKYGITTNELQLDCDWTLKTKEAYFRFVEEMKERNRGWRFSATIRLHQVKYYEKTGVPPVDYGVLMYYNMGQITAMGGNSIYERSTAKGYIKRLKEYKLPLNIALPMFSWGVHSVRDEVVNLIGGLTAEEMNAIEGVRLTEVPNVYKVEKQTYYKGRLWQVGDKIKIEEVNEGQREEMLKDLGEVMREAPKEVIYFR